MNEEEEPKSEFPNVTGEGLTSESAKEKRMKYKEFTKYRVRVEEAVKKLTKAELKDYLREALLEIKMLNDTIGEEHLEMIEDAVGGI